MSYNNTQLDTWKNIVYAVENYTYFSNVYTLIQRKARKDHKIGLQVV